MHNEHITTQTNLFNITEGTQMKKIVEPQGYFLKDVRLTEAGRKKVLKAFEWHFEGGWAIAEGLQNDPFFYDKFVVGGVGTAEDWVFDVESESFNGMLHPRLEINGEKIELTEGIDYVIEMQSEEAFDLELIAQRLNETHKTFEAELKRLGW